MRSEDWIQEFESLRASHRGVRGLGTIQRGLMASMMSLRASQRNLTPVRWVSEPAGVRRPAGRVQGLAKGS